ncbi:WD40 repeat domain-containing protein [Criblamydia sequanensis]|uniref:Pyrrolo-quinoline quinone repeat domain-containing protein n=1 Tax=Candidatus Criblamydia sequanensis CRIB-18 TaxID=1437425 RepID=A0A090CZ05_9BACT|nr:WD40 repeat domain-containing protein [Criblamydia sequanensis]CDR33891.1 hypothetical protein CSEC_1065 [Criblamydia sequanensis CRIB-18]
MKGRLFETLKSTALSYASEKEKNNEVQFCLKSLKADLRMRSPRVLPKAEIFNLVPPSTEQFNINEFFVKSTKFEGKRVYTSFDDRTIRVWDMESKEQLLKIVSPNRVTEMIITKDKITSGDSEGTLRIWNKNSGEEILSLADGHNSAISSIKFDSDRIYSGSWGETIMVWDASTGKQVMKLEGHKESITDLQIVEGKIISSSSDGTIRIWEAETGKELFVLEDAMGEITSLQVEDGKLYSSSFDGIIRVWDIKTGQLLQKMEGHNFPITVIRIFDGKIIGVSLEDKEMVHIWDINTGKKLKSLKSTQATKILNLNGFDGKIYASNTYNEILSWDFNPKK